MVNDDVLDRRRKLREFLGESGSRGQAFGMLNNYLQSKGRPTISLTTFGQDYKRLLQEMVTDDYLRGRGGGGKP